MDGVRIGKRKAPLISNGSIRIPFRLSLEFFKHSLALHDILVIPLDLPGFL